MFWTGCGPVRGSPEVWCTVLPVRCSVSFCVYCVLLCILYRCSVLVFYVAYFGGFCIVLWCGCVLYFCVYKIKKKNGNPKIDVGKGTRASQCSSISTQSTDSKNSGARSHGMGTRSATKFHPNRNSTSPIERTTVRTTKPHKRSTNYSTQ